MYLYLLSNDKLSKLYIGITDDLDRRLKEHNYSTNHFTGRVKGEWKLIGSIEFNNKSEAKKEELRLKKTKNKKYIIWYFRNRQGP